MRSGIAYSDRSSTVVARMAPFRSRITPRLAATTRSLRTWSVARASSAARPKVCQYARRPARTSEATANSANSRRRRRGRTVCTLPPSRAGGLALRDERLRGDHRDVARVDHAEPLGTGRDARGGVQQRDLDLEERVLAEQLVPLGGALLDVVAGDREGRRLRHVQERKTKGEDDRGDRDTEDAEIPGRGRQGPSGGLTAQRDFAGPAAMRRAAQGNGRDSAAAAPGFARRGRAPFRGR